MQLTMIGLPVLGWLPNEKTNTNYTDGRHVHYEYVVDEGNEETIEANRVCYDPYTCLYSADVKMDLWEETIAVSKCEGGFVCHMVKVIFNKNEQIIKDYKVIVPDNIEMEVKKNEYV